MMRPHHIALAALLALAGCGEPDDRLIDAAVADAALIDAPSSDGSPDATAIDGGVPLPGFGDITGMCGTLGNAALLGPDPTIFRDEITFGDRYDDPIDRPRLTPGGLQMILDGNAGGSSLYSEVFAYELLARCENAVFLKSETQIVYDTNSKKTDLLVSINGRKYGVSVVRAVTFPFGMTYTPTAATTMMDGKLDDILLSTASVSAQDRWGKQILAVLAYNQQHADAVITAWMNLDTATRADTIVIVTVTSGDDMFIYTDQ